MRKNINIIIPDHHITITSVDKVRSICKWLFNNTEIKYFHYQRIFHDGTGIMLTTDGKWQQHYFKHGYQTNPELLCLCNMTSNIFLEAQINSSSAKDFNTFGYDQMLLISKKYPHQYLEVCGFGAQNGNRKIITFYFQNIKALQLFIKHFRQAASELIDRASEKRNLLPTLPYGLDLAIKSKQNVNTEELLLHHIQQLCFANLEKSILTNRERECLFYLLRCRTAKEIAQILNISFKTVEMHICHIKEKLNCQTKSKIFDRAVERGIINDVVVDERE